MGADRNKVCVCRKEGPYFSVAVHFIFSQTFSLLSYQLIELKLVPSPPVLLFQDKYNVQPCFPILLTPKQLKCFSFLFPIDDKNR